MKAVLFALALAALPFAALAQTATDADVMAAEGICHEHLRIPQARVAPPDPNREQWSARCKPVFEKAQAIRERNRPQEEKDKAAKVDELVRKLGK